MKRFVSLLIALTAIALPSISAFAQERSVTLSVPGMTCPICPITVSKALNRLTGVHVKGVDLDKRTIEVSVRDSHVLERDLTKATSDAGYPSTVLRKEQHEAR